MRAAGGKWDIKYERIVIGILPTSHEKKWRPEDRAITSLNHWINRGFFVAVQPKFTKNLPLKSSEPEIYTETVGSVGNWDSGEKLLTTD